MEPLTTLLLPAITETVFGSLAEAVGLSDWLRDRLKRDPEKLAFQQVLTQTLTDTAQQFPGRDLRYFAEVLRDVGGPLLARTLQPAATLPTADELTQLWLNHLTIDSKIHYRQEFERFATLFLDRLIYHIKNQQPLQWIVQARRARSSEEAMRRTAAASEQSVAHLDTLRKEIVELGKRLEDSLNNRAPAIHTEGVAYIGGGVSAQNFAGRDLTIKNYIIDGLVHVSSYDPIRRVRKFLNEYLGSEGNPVPFGGRQMELDELNAWIDDPTGQPYYLMAAEAGRGKSALVCRWMAQLLQRNNVDVVFIPISIRFETASQKEVFEALAARFAKVHHEEHRGGVANTAISPDQWRKVCETYLDRPLPGEKQVVVILDGLDEATDWKLGVSFFSDKPPVGLKVLVTARLRATENTPLDWASTLGWKDKIVRTKTLPPLTIAGVEEALLSMGNPLDKLATKVDVVGELHRLSEGDPLLVRLYVDALVAEKERVATLQAEDLRNIKPGLAGYFDRWWQDQQEQWRIQGRDPIVEQAHLRTLLNAIAAALGPLLLDDLAALHPDLVDSMLVRRLIQQVSRWLVGDGKTQGYSYSHPRLGYFFWEQLGEHEQKAWDDRFVGWGTRVLAELNADTLAPERAPRYLLQHYAAHLERADAADESLYALISNGWRKAWELIDVSYGGFLNDVDRAIGRGYLALTAKDGRKIPVVINQVKAAFCHSSIITLNGNVPAVLLKQLVISGIWSSIQALSFTKISPSEEIKAERIILLASIFPHELMNEVLMIISMMSDEKNIANSLCSIAMQLQEDLVIIALEITSNLQDVKLRSDVLIKFHPRLSESQIYELFAKLLDDMVLVDEEQSQMQPDKLLLKLLLKKVKPFLPRGTLLKKVQSILDKVVGENELDPSPDSEVSRHDRNNDHEVRFQSKLSDASMTTILKDAYADGDRSEFIKILTELAPQLSNALLIEMLALIRNIDDRYRYAHCVSTLIPYLPDNVVTKNAIENFITSVSSNEEIYNDIYGNSDALKSVLPYVDEHIISDVVASVCESESERSLAHALDILLPFVPYRLLESILIEIESIKCDDGRAIALGAFASRLSTERRSVVLDQALAFARMTYDENDLAEALCIIAPHLSEDLAVRVLEDACSLEDRSHQTIVLTSLMPSLPLYTRREVALSVFRALDVDYNNYDDVITLSRILPFLPSKRQMLAISSVSDYVSKTDNCYECANILGILAHNQAWWNENLKNDWFRILNIALSALTKYQRPDCFINLSALMPFILALAGDEAPQAAEGIYHAIQEVCEWWP